MRAVLLAFRTTWIGFLLIAAGVFLGWLVVRAMVDLAVWFKEEIIDEWRDQRGKSGGP